MMISSPGAVSEFDLGADGLLRSDLWVDRPDAAAEAERRVAAGEMTATEAENLVKFAKDGYFVFRPSVPDELFEAIDADVERLWREQPPWMSFAYHSLLTRFGPGGDEAKRLPSSRIADLHDFSAAALELYLHPQLFRYVELILGQPAVATQSLYFQWGSLQALHRDPIHVRMKPPAHLVASWFALEDIRPGSGELHYVPGSQKAPYFEFESGRYFFDHKKDAPERAREAERWDLERCAERGLREEALLCKRGECLVWHHSLLHGGSPLDDDRKTRKSFVVHYTSAANMPETLNSYVDRFAAAGPGDASPPVRIYRSDRLHRMRGCRGFRSPLAEQHGREMRELFGGQSALDQRMLEKARELDAVEGDRSRLAEEIRELCARNAATEERMRQTALASAAVRGEIEAMKSSKFWKLRDAWWSAKRAIGLAR